MGRFNEWLGLRVTRVVGSMYCAYAFALLTLTSLPSNLDSVAHFVQWVSTSFLQLVLLSVILVGQEIQSRQSEALLRETHDAVFEELKLLRHTMEGK
jgi:uncharacterized membrane protein